MKDKSVLIWLTVLILTSISLVFQIASIAMVTFKVGAMYVFPILAVLILVSVIATLIGIWVADWIRRCS